MPVLPSTFDEVPGVQSLGANGGGHDAWDVEFAGDDRGVAHQPAYVDDERVGQEHDGYPGRVGGVGDQDVAGVDLGLRGIQDHDGATGDDSRRRGNSGEHRFRRMVGLDLDGGDRIARPRGRDFQGEVPLALCVALCDKRFQIRCRIPQRGADDLSQFPG